MYFSEQIALMLHDLFLQRTPPPPLFPFKVALNIFNNPRVKTITKKMFRVHLYRKLPVRGSCFSKPAVSSGCGALVNNSKNKDW